MVDPNILQTVGTELTKEVVNSNSKFLSMVFKPGADELGLMLRDKIRCWRLNNIMSILKKAQDKLHWDGQDLQLTANARVGFAIFEEGSVVDDDELQNMWAGLFASSCTGNGKDESNLVYVDILRHLSSFEARILKYACENSTKYRTKNSLILGSPLKVSLDQIMQIGGIADITLIDSSFDHMTSLHLFNEDLFSAGGFDAEDSSLTADIGPSALALNLYYKTTAPIGKSVIDFWGNQLQDYGVYQKDKGQADKQVIEEIWKK